MIVMGAVGKPGGQVSRDAFCNETNEVSWKQHLIKHLAISIELSHHR